MANKGFDPKFGARPLRRAVQRHIEAPLSKRIISGEYEVGDTILVGVDEEADDLVFERRPDEPIPLEQVIRENKTSDA